MVGLEWGLRRLDFLGLAKMFESIVGQPQVILESGSSTKVVQLDQMRP